ncbi:hypothetical protein [Nocardia brasiliensis]|uniref:hypothetical protein n=1 Tax=Nocardia brasiliensis TaxID=37326 RepID=UPI003D94A6A6
MSDEDPWKHPIRRFFTACLLVLFGMAALSLAVDLLVQIWPWLAGIGIIVGVILIGIAIWRTRRQPW